MFLWFPTGGGATLYVAGLKQTAVGWSHHGPTDHPRPWSTHQRTAAKLALPLGQRLGQRLWKTMGKLYSYGHLLVITGYFDGIIHSINGVISTYNIL